MTKIVKLTVELEVDDSYNVQEVINEMDYRFEHDAIISTEIEDFHVEGDNGVYGY